MGRFLVFIISGVLWSGLHGDLAWAADEIAVTNFPGCIVDIDGDRDKDKVFLTNDGELFFLLNQGKVPHIHYIDQRYAGTVLSCHLGGELKETKLSGRKGQTFKTPGAYIRLNNPKGPPIAFFWNGKKFQEVWVANETKTMRVIE